MQNLKIKKGDKVKILRGKDRGREGKVVQVFAAANQVVVEGLNLRYRHLRPRRANEKGQRVEFPGPIAASNVMLIDAKTGQPTRVGFKQDNLLKVRISRKSGDKL